MIREELEVYGITVIDIASSDLNDPEATRRHYRRIAFALSRPDPVAEEDETGG
jgi:hypothetical protein